MITTVTQKNMVTIPAALSRQLGIVPGYQLDWQVGATPDELRVRILPSRATLARRLLGAGQRYEPARDAVAELAVERSAEG